MGIPGESYELAECSRQTQKPVPIVVSVLIGILLTILPPLRASSQIRFRDVSRSSGIEPASSRWPERRYIVEMMGGGIALFDCDNDGKLDIVVVNDSTVDRYLRGGDPMITLYHQDASLHFTDVTEKSGLTTRGWGMGVAIGDFDNDGLPDILVTGYGHNAIYRNLGGCKFQDVTEQAHLVGGGFSVGAAWADYDRDGYLDLFVSRYIDSDIHHLPTPGRTVLQLSRPTDGGPMLNGQTDFLYRNRGDGTFEDVSEKACVSNPDKRLGMGVVWADYDNDGWPDLLVTNDMGPNFLYHNMRDGTFRDVGLWAGTAVGEGGEELGNMAADFADIDHAGSLDLFITRYYHQPMSLYRNLGDKGFSDITRSSHLSLDANNAVRWGSGFADFENDGWPDIFVANGISHPWSTRSPTSRSTTSRCSFFRNNGNLTFTEVTADAGLNMGQLQSRRGTAFGDINNDGKVDVVVYNAGGPPSIFLNVTATSNHSVLFRLVGTKSNRKRLARE
jgi:hypothetical protein